ncbi:hypothetical protein DL764_009508 [Monosporascus ibericus]|uniref:Uncharacterized protein n=1 Tax=Monosporascus ibericus TaxID=155417 RepID=A0A4Q4SUS0_9PEZI|nr:hypothetical protein DL764_009508 [Monosporascus ibericus]
MPLLDNTSSKTGSSDTNRPASALAVALTLVSLSTYAGQQDNAERDWGQTSLFLWAIQCGHEAVVQLLLTGNVMHVKEMDGQGKPALQLAAEVGYEGIVRLLVEKGADIEADYNNKTALYCAAYYGHESVVRLLLEKGAEINGWWAYKGTPLHGAVWGENEAIARLLIEKGADITLEWGNPSWTALDFAAERGLEVLVQLLLEKGANVGAKTHEALHMAAKGGHEAVVRLLLEWDNVDVNSTDWYDQTPLSHAARAGHDAVVRLLLEHKDVDINSKNRMDGKTPLIYAAEAGRDAVVRLLLEKGARFKERDEKGQTALQLASGNGHNIVVRLLESKCI